MTTRERLPRTMATALAACCLAAAIAGPARAQGFDSGSDGSLGDVLIDANTEIPLPEDGRLHYGRLTVQGATVTFARNARNTPVWILATEEIVLDEAVIDVSAGSPRALSAGPGGFDGGEPGQWGRGPGGGRPNPTCPNRRSWGVFAPASVQPGDPPGYGSSLLLSLVGGSGGGGDELATFGSPSVGGGGGGAVVLAAPRITFRGTSRVRAWGVARLQFCDTARQINSGSGGAIRLVAPEVVVDGTAVLDVRCLRFSNNTLLTCPGRGRIRVDTAQAAPRFTVLGTTLPSFGKFLKVFPDVEPRLRLVEVAGQPIAPGAVDPVAIDLPSGSPRTQPVVVELSGFEGVVDFEVTLVPESAEEPRRYPVSVAVAGGAPTEVELDVEFFVEPTFVNAWIR